MAIDPASVLADAVFVSLDTALKQWGDLPLTWQDDGLDHIDDSFIVEMSYFGLLSGTISLLCPRALATRIADEIIGQFGAADKNEIISSALMEMVNIVTGVLVVSVYGDDVAFHLTLPTCREEPRAVVPHKYSKLYRFTIHEMPLYVMLRDITTADVDPGRNPAFCEKDSAL